MRLPTASPTRYRRITGLTLGAVGTIIVTGAAVRLTGSGLGCPEWPTCGGGRVVAPLETHALVEFGNRVVSGLVAVPVLLALIGSRRRDPRRADLTRWSAGLAAGVAAEAVLGGVLVKVHLAPLFTSAHFLSSMVLVGAAVVLHHRAGTSGAPAVPVVDAAAVRLGRLLVALAAAVLVTGAVVTGTGPHAGDERAERYGFSITAVARVHSLTAWAFLLAAVALLWRLTRGGAPAAAHAGARRLVVAIVVQGALGYAQYAAGVPPYLVLVHVAGAVLVFVAALWLHLSLFARPGGIDAPAGGDRRADPARPLARA